MIMTGTIQQLLMNPQFQVNRSPVQSSGNPFYNPQKDAPNPNNPTLYQGQQQGVSPFMPNSSSKSYIARSNILQANKAGNNTSAYLKNPNDSNLPTRFVPGNATSPMANYSNNNQNGFVPPFLNKPTEMIKSTIQQNGRSSESNFGYPMLSPQKPAFLSNTPNRRAPRMSEPHQFDNNNNFLPKNTDPKPTSQAINESPLQKRFRDPKQFESHFFKTKQGSSVTTVDEKQPKQSKELKQSAGSTKFEGKITKSQIWSKSSLGKKRTITVNDFIKIKELGSGKYGQVSLVRDKNSGFTCALKKIQKKLLKEEDIVQQFIRQLKIQMFLNHPNIIKMYGYFDDQSYIYIILEVGTGGQLFHQLKRSQPMAQNKVAPIIKQVCQAVNQIHSLRIIHRDIKPQNIVIHDNVIKLCDFGWSVYQDNRLRTTFCGTPLYVCPQILKGKQYDQKIDIWSLGIMMYEMLVGQNPFKITKEEQLIKIVKDQITIPSYVFVSRQGRDFLDKCLKKNPDDRVNIKELLNHQFFVKNAQKGDKKMAF